MKPKFSPGQLIKAIGDDPQFATFRVLSVKNGWIRCTVEYFHDGTWPSGVSVGWVAKFRTTEMRVAKEAHE